MVETTLDIRFSGADDPRVDAWSNETGDVRRQAELVCAAHYAARMIVVLGAERASALVRLLDVFDGSVAEIQGRGDGRIRTTATFHDTRSGPRASFRVRPRGLSLRTEEGATLAVASVHAVLRSLLARHGDEVSFAPRVATTARLVAKLGAEGEITARTELDVGLAAADVAWRREPPTDTTALRASGGRCPSCDSIGTFEPRLWPSGGATLDKCTACGSGVWVRTGQRPRLLAPQSWQAMEALRDRLRPEEASAAAGSDAAPEPAGEDRANELLAQTKAAFAANDWPFSEVRGRPVLVSALSGPLGSWTFYAQVTPEHGAILLYSVCPLRVPEERRPEMASFLTRANYGLAAGNFELDLDDGEIRCKTVVDVDDELNSAILTRLVRANGLAMETYLPGIGAVITGASAVSALARAER